MLLDSDIFSLALLFAIFFPRIVIISSMLKYPTNNLWDQYESQLIQEIAFCNIAEAASQQCSEKMAILQMSELGITCSITKNSTTQHVFLRNFPYC